MDEISFLFTFVLLGSYSSMHATRLQSVVSTFYFAVEQYNSRTTLGSIYDALPHKQVAASADVELKACQTYATDVTQPLAKDLNILLKRGCSRIRRRCARDSA